MIGYAVKRSSVGRLVLTALVLAVLVIGSATFVSCSPRTVAVKTGQRVVCTYGEQVDSTVRTIRVPAKDAGKYSVKTVTVTCDKHRALEQAYVAAQIALAKKDFATAKAELEKVVKVDSTYRLARRQLDEIVAGKEPAPDTGTNAGGTTPSTPPTSTTPGAQDPPVGPVASLLVYTPDSLAGYRAEQVAADVFSVSRVYLPTSSTQIKALVIVAEQHQSAEAAKNWVRDNVRQRYTQSGRNVRVGDHDAYVGTDGTRFAVIAWTEGPIAVAVEADTKGKPNEVLAQLQQLASSLAQ